MSPSLAIVRMTLDNIDLILEKIMTQDNSEVAKQFNYVIDK